MGDAIAVSNIGEIALTLGGNQTYDSGLKLRKFGKMQKPSRRDLALAFGVARRSIGSS